MSSRFTLERTLFAALFIIATLVATVIVAGGSRADVPELEALVVPAAAPEAPDAPPAPAAPAPPVGVDEPAAAATAPAISAADANAVAIAVQPDSAPASEPESVVAPTPEPVATPEAVEAAAEVVPEPAAPAEQAAAAAETTIAETQPASDLIEIDVHAAQVPDPPAPGASTTTETVLVPEPYDPWQPVRMCESTDNYTINTGNGFYGAYQFTISTWNWVAGIIGRTDLVGVRPDRAAPADQDRMADALAFEVAGGGLGHWPVCGRYYGT